MRYDDESFPETTASAADLCARSRGRASGALRHGKLFDLLRSDSSLVGELEVIAGPRAGSNPKPYPSDEELWAWQQAAIATLMPRAFPE